jgi:hypothetical protein
VELLLFKKISRLIAKHEVAC